MVASIVMMLALILAIPLFAEAAPVGKITQVEGRVDVLKPGSQAIAPVALGDAVDVGNIYRTKTASQAEITFYNKNIMKIDPATRVEITQYSVEQDKINQVMKLQRGRVQTISGEEFIKKVSSAAEGNKFEVHTPNAVAGIRGSWQITSFTNFTTGVFQKTGNGYFFNPLSPGTIVNMIAGYVSFIIGTNGTPTPPRLGNEAYLGGTGGTTLALGGGGGSGGGGTLLTGGTAGGGMPPIFTPPINVSTPSVFVGSIACMSGSVGGYDYVEVSLNNVKFYGSGATSKPQIWYTTSVTGSYSNSEGGITPGLTGSISGGGASATFTLTNYHSQVWAGTITNGSAPGGVGGYKQPVGFSGVVGGSYTSGTTGSISGVAAGTAH